MVSVHLHSVSLNGYHAAWLSQKHADFHLKLCLPGPHNTSTTLCRRRLPVQPSAALDFQYNPLPPQTSSTALTAAGQTTESLIGRTAIRLGICSDSTPWRIEPGCRHIGRRVPTDTTRRSVQYRATVQSVPSGEPVASRPAVGLLVRD